MNIAAFTAAVYRHICYICFSPVIRCTWWKFQRCGFQTLLFPQFHPTVIERLWHSRIFGYAFLGDMQDMKSVGGTFDSFLIQDHMHDMLQIISKCYSSHSFHSFQANFIRNILVTEGHCTLQIIFNPTHIKKFSHWTCRPVWTLKAINIW